MYYDAKEQHTLSDDLVKAFKEAEIPEASLVHFGWMFHGTEMTGEYKERLKSDEVNESAGNQGNLLSIPKKRRQEMESFRISTLSHHNTLDLSRQSKTNVYQ